MLCEASFPKKLAFAYLEDLQAEFHEQHGKKVITVSRPYSFIEFGKKRIELRSFLSISRTIQWNNFGFKYIVKKIIVLCVA